MKFYLAGKISQGDEWRTAFIGPPYEWPHDIRSYDGEDYLEATWPIWKDAIAPGYDYTGPYFIAVGEAGNHYISRQDSHALVPDYVPAHNWDPVQDLIYGRCLRAIDAADTVYAWIDSLDCYGTIFELGYALARKKRIWIATSGESDFSDLWFSLNSADIRVWGRNALDGFEECVNRVLREGMLSAKGIPGAEGYVYLVKMGDVYKIGRTKDLDRRLQQFRPVLPYPPELIVAYPTPDPVKVESLLHKQYSHLRLEGEWFNLGPTEVQEIRDMRFFRLTDKSRYRDGGQHERLTTPIRYIPETIVEGGVA